MPPAVGGLNDLLVDAASKPPVDAAQHRKAVAQATLVRKEKRSAGAANKPPKKPASKKRSRAFAMVDETNLTEDHFTFSDSRVEEPRF